MDLENIIKRAKADNSGFKEIYDLTINRLFSFVLLRVKDRALALDLCQDIYLDLWQGLPRFEYMGDAHFYSFLFLVARRKIIKARIKKVDQIDIDDIFDIQAPEAQHEDYRFLMKQVERLNENEQRCIEMRYFSDMSFGQVAEDLNTTENNVKVIHHRAIKKLREFIPKYYE